MSADNGTQTVQLHVTTQEQKEEYIERVRGELDSLVAYLLDVEKELERQKRLDPASAALYAIEILQFARYVPVMELFVRQLDMRRSDFPIVSDEKPAHFPFFPFAVALAAIGTTAVPALTTGILSLDPTTTRFQLSCLVLREILGEELALHHLTNAAKDDGQARDAQWSEEVARLVRMNPNAWVAMYCSDYSAQ